MVIPYLSHKYVVLKMKYYSLYIITYWNIHNVREFLNENWKPHNSQNYVWCSIAK